MSELQQLQRVCEARGNGWLWAVIELAVETEMRRGELLKMQWADVNLAARTVHLHNTKNRHPRTVPLSPRAVEIISATPRAGNYVFPVTANALRLAWERLRRRAGVSGLRFHDLRHEAVSRFFEKGLNMPEVGPLAGTETQECSCDTRILKLKTLPLSSLRTASPGAISGPLFSVGFGKNVPTPLSKNR